MLGGGAQSLDGPVKLRLDEENLGQLVVRFRHSLFVLHPAEGGDGVLQLLPGTFQISGGNKNIAQEKLNLGNALIVTGMFQMLISQFSLFLRLAVSGQS